MDDVDVLPKGAEKGWWEEPDPKRAHEKYLAMHNSPTNRAKLAITTRLMQRLDWSGKSVLEYGCGGGYFTVWMAKLLRISLTPGSLSRVPVRKCS